MSYLIKILKTKDKGKKVLNAAREKEYTTYMGTTFQTTVHFSSVTIQARTMWFQDELKKLSTSNSIYRRNILQQLSEN